MRLKVGGDVAMLPLGNDKKDAAKVENNECVAKTKKYEELRKKKQQKDRQIKSIRKRKRKPKNSNDVQDQVPHHLPDNKSNNADKMEKAKTYNAY